MAAPSHEPVVVYFDEDHVETPAEVCGACSDWKAGVWVPASFCPQARALLAALAQQAEQAPCMGKVVGSKPAGGSPGSSNGRTRYFGCRYVGSTPAPGALITCPLSSVG